METIIRMTIIDWLIFWFAIGVHAPLIIGIIKQKDDKSQTFFTWGLYFLLDIITMFSSKKIESHSFALLFGFSVGSFVMSSILFYQKRFGWRNLETITILLVGTCICAWWKGGPYVALLAGIVSEVIVGIYLIIKTFRNPVFEYNFWGYLLFFIISLFTFITTPDLSIKQIGYPACEMVLSIVILMPLLNARWK